MNCQACTKEINLKQANWILINNLPVHTKCYKSNGKRASKAPSNTKEKAKCRKTDGLVDLNKYYATKHWQKIATKAKKIYKTCMFCNSSHKLNVHHRHYRTLFRENVNADLSLICADCHWLFHTFKADSVEFYDLQDLRKFKNKEL